MRRYDFASFERLERSDMVVDYEALDVIDENGWLKSKNEAKVIIDGIEFESVDDATEYIVAEMSDDEKEDFECPGMSLADAKALCGVDKSARCSAMATYDSNIASCIACDITDMEADCEEEICGHCVKLLAE